MGELVKLLKIDQLPDFHRTQNGWIAKRRVDIAPLAFEVVVNNPLGHHMKDRIAGFCGGACERMALRLFGLCNGLHIGATKFSVYGVLGQTVARDAQDEASHIPFDINIPNLYGRPEGWSEEVLVVGTGSETNSDGQKTKLKHGITADCEIIVAEENSYEKPARLYQSVEDWLTFEVGRALADDSRY